MSEFLAHLPLAQMICEAGGLFRHGAAGRCLLGGYAGRNIGAVHGPV